MANKFCHQRLFCSHYKSKFIWYLHIMVFLNFSIANEQSSLYNHQHTHTYYHDLILSFHIFHIFLSKLDYFSSIKDGKSFPFYQLFDKNCTNSSEFYILIYVPSVLLVDFLHLQSTLSNLSNDSLMLLPLTHISQFWAVLSYC